MFNFQLEINRWTWDLSLSTYSLATRLISTFDPIFLLFVRFGALHWPRLVDGAWNARASSSRAGPAIFGAGWLGTATGVRSHSRSRPCSAALGAIRWTKSILTLSCASRTNNAIKFNINSTRHLWLIQREIKCSVWTNGINPFSAQSMNSKNFYNRLVSLETTTCRTDLLSRTWFCQITFLKIPVFSNISFVNTDFERSVFA